MNDVQAVVLNGYGINCEREMAVACRLAGAECRILHLHSLLSGQISLEEVDLLCFPGGFSFGDELGAAKALANKINCSPLKNQLRSFVDEGKCIIGICNGFQLLVKLGLLPNLGEQQVSLAYNVSNRFESRWIHHKVLPSPCVFTQGLTGLNLPIRHAEGRFVVDHEETLQNLEKNQQVVLRYEPENPNGSVNAIAGICDPSGRVFGMMAHPEAAIFFTQKPQWTRIRETITGLLPKYGEGLELFKNAVNFLRENKCQMI